MITAKTIRLPLKAAERLIHIPSGVALSELVEVRLRAGRRAVLVTADGRRIPCEGTLSREDIEECFQELCRHSVHSYAREISEGYITLEGGHRAGFCGTAVIKDGRICTLKDISSINLRLAHEIKGCGEALYHTAFSSGIRSLLIAGRPLSGKTTVLRDITRLVGGKHRTALIDSRNEIAASSGGVPSLDVGENTDVLSGYPRYEGMMIALRTLSPEVLVCDEIGGDINAIEQCADCGVKLIATVHAASFEELDSNPVWRRLIPKFDCTALLGGKGQTLGFREAAI